MELPNCRKCGNQPTFFTPKGGGSGVQCDTCGDVWYHPDFTVEQIARIWAYKNGKEADDEER